MIDNDCFYAEKRGKKENIWEYIETKLKTDTTLKIYLAIDSKRRKSKTTYVISLVLYSPILRKGAEVWYKKIIEPTPPDMFMRLWKEVELANEWGLIIWEKLKHILIIKDNLGIHMDLNPNPKTKSFKVYKAGYPWINSLGFNVKVKPESWACRAADHLS